MFLKSMKVAVVAMLTFVSVTSFAETWCHDKAAWDAGSEFYRRATAGDSEPGTRSSMIDILEVQLLQQSGRTEVYKVTAGINRGYGNKPFKAELVISYELGQYGGCTRTSK